MAPLVWDEYGWPIVGNNGKIALEMEGDFPENVYAYPPSEDFEDNFDSQILNLNWNFVRNPKQEKYSLTEKKGFLKLSAGKETLNDNSPTFVGIRQKEFELCVRTKLLLAFSGENEKAGLTAFYNQYYHYEIYVTRESEKYYAVFAKKVHDMEYVARKVEIDYQGIIEFQIKTGKQDYTFSYCLKEEWITLGTGKTAGLCTEATMMMTFTGTYLGIFASNTTAYFDYFSARAM